MLLLAQSLEVVSKALDRGLVGVLALVVVVLAGVVVWLYRERLEVETRYRENVVAIQVQCAKEQLALSAEFRAKSEQLLREQQQLSAASAEALRAFAAAEGRRRGAK